MHDQITLHDPSKRELALERSQKISRALHDAARKARQTVRGTTVWQPGFSRARRGSRHFALVTALTVCIGPTLVLAAYLGLVASDQYQVEAKFAVRNRETLGTDLIGSLTGLPALQQAQDGLVVMDYVKSRAIVEKIDGQLDIRSMFSRPGIDFFSRSDASEPIEEFVRYWHSRVKVDVKLPSGIMELKVRAFSPEDALRISNAVIVASEQLVNDISNRSRQDAVTKALEEVNRAEERLAVVRERTRTTRNEQSLIDPKKSGDELIKVLSELEFDRSKLQTELQVGARRLSPSAPQMQQLKAKLEAQNDRIAEFRSTMTTGNAAGRSGTLSGSYAEFDKARLDQEWAEKYYQTVAGSLEKARVDNERQQVYLEAFVQPILPQQAEYPRRLWIISLMALGSTAAWLALNYVRSLLRS